jgi:hypothetical protein
MSAQQAPGDPRVVYEGSARDYPARGADEELLLRHAVLDAYGKGIAGKEPKFTQEGEPVPYQFRVVGIFVEGINPPTDYKVQLVDNP